MFNIWPNTILHSNISKEFKRFAKVAKFRLILSHWLRPSLSACVYLCICLMRLLFASLHTSLYKG